MDLSYSDEQQHLRENLSSFFSKESTPERVRAAEPSGFDTELWDKIVAMGLPAMAVPEDLGGGGASSLDLVLTAEEFGKRIPPVAAHRGGRRHEPARTAERRRGLRGGWAAPR